VIDETQQNTKNYIAKLFPEMHSTISLSDLILIYKELDLDADGQVSKKEILHLFEQNRGILVTLFSKKIVKALQRLNEQTM